MEFLSTHQPEVTLAVCVAFVMFVINFLRIVSEVNRGMATLPVMFVNAVLDVDYDFTTCARNHVSQVPTVYRNSVYIPGQGLVDSEYGQLIYSLSDHAIYVRGLFGIRLLQTVNTIPSVQPNGDGCYSMFVFGAWRNVHENCVSYMRKMIYTNNHS